VTRDAALEAYWAEAASWDQDRVRGAQRTLRLAIGAGALGWFTALAACGALLALMPLKRVEPFVIRVDNTTGIVDVVPTAVGAQAPAEAVTRYFLAHYVQVCERFAWATAESDYEECAAMHAPARNQRWAARWARSNPDSPLNRYADGTALSVQVSAVSFFARGSGVQDLAQVRYVIAKRSPDGAVMAQTHWIATIQYAYTAPASDPRDRRWNPLGFKVLDFRPEPETPPAPLPPAERDAAVTAGAVS
jgi:type IV secretion system protein VirB8